MEEKDSLGLNVTKAGDFSEWYSQVVQKADLADYTSVSGCMVFKPYSYEIWEKTRDWFDRKIKQLGHKNAYFPLLIPERLLKKESEHVEGFSPEVAWVTHAGKSKLAERLAIRPTSETIMYESYAKWIRSHRDLPLLLNQWCNVVRWEFKYPKPFIRTREFLWQEGHTAHATEEDADREVMSILDIYTDLIENYYAIPVIRGKKSDKEKFAGALYTTTMEALMPDGKALQMGTSHNLGQNFSKAFGISFIDKDEKTKYVWQTSWGIATRLIGAMIMVHGDDKGLIIPPRIAPIQAVVIPIIFKKNREELVQKAKEIKDLLKGIEVTVDDRDEYSVGWKYNEWELKGVPVRIEVGPRDIQKDQVVIVRRDTGDKAFVRMSDIRGKVKETLSSIQDNIFKKAQDFLHNNTVETLDWKEFQQAIKDKKMVKTQWCGSSECEELIKDKSDGASSRCIPFDQPEVLGACVHCGNKALYSVYFSKAY
ncbi:MAG: proline--tRNA ligase [archaeon]